MLSIVGTVIGLMAVVRVLPRELALLWPLGFFSGIAGLVLSLQELGSITRGESPASGRRLAAQARAFSFLHVGIIAFFFACLALVGFMQGFSRHR